MLDELCIVLIPVQSFIILEHRDLSPDLNHDGKITPNEFIKECPCFDAMPEYHVLQPEGFWEGKPIYK